MRRLNLYGWGIKSQLNHIIPLTRQFIYTGPSSPPIHTYWPLFPTNSYILAPLPHQFIHTGPSHPPIHTYWPLSPANSYILAPLTRQFIHTGPSHPPIHTYRPLFPTNSYIQAYNNSTSKHSKRDEINIIIYLYKIAILHHGMQSFHIIIDCTPVYCTLVYCTIAGRSDRFATSISLREHANERYAAQNIW